MAAISKNKRGSGKPMGKVRTKSKTKVAKRKEVLRKRKMKQVAKSNRKKK